MRHGAMSTAAADADLERSERGHHGAIAGHTSAHGKTRPVVQRIDAVAGKSLEQSLLDHAPAAALVLFRRLKDEVHRAIEVGQIRAHARGREGYGGVAVMSASMHDTRDSRDVWCAALLPDRQRIHVSAYADGAPAGAPCQRSDHPRSGETPMPLQSEPLELGGDEFRGLPLAEGELRVSMQMMSPRDSLGQQIRVAGIGGVHRWHGIPADARIPTEPR